MRCRARLQNAEGLQHGGALGPWAGLEHVDTAECQRDRQLLRRREASHVGRGDDARVVAPRRVPTGLLHELLDRDGDLPALPHSDSGMDALLPCRGQLTRADEARERRGPRLVADHVARLGDATAGHPLVVGGAPVLLEQGRNCGDRAHDGGHDGVAVLRIAEGGGEHVVQFPGAAVGEKRQPGHDRAGDGRGQHASPGNLVEPERAVVLDGRGGGGRTLAGEHERRLARGRDETGEVATWPVEVRLDDVQHERAGDGGIDGGAAALEH